MQIIKRFQHRGIQVAIAVDGATAHCQYLFQGQRVKAKAQLPAGDPESIPYRAVLSRLERYAVETIDLRLDGAAAPAPGSAALQCGSSGLPSEPPSPPNLCSSASSAVTSPAEPLSSEALAKEGPPPVNPAAVLAALPLADQRAIASLTDDDLALLAEDADDQVPAKEIARTFGLTLASVPHAVAYAIAIGVWLPGAGRPTDEHGDPIPSARGPVPAAPRAADPTTHHAPRTTQH